MQELQLDFPDLVILTNARNVLPSRLELDIYIPSLTLGIELNGPLHYYPFHGQEKLAAIRAKDALKQHEAKVVGCELLTINISKYKYWKQTAKLVDEVYTREIVPTIETLMKAREGG